MHLESDQGNKVLPPDYETEATGRREDRWEFYFHSFSFILLWQERQLFCTYKFNTKNKLIFYWKKEVPGCLATKGPKFSCMPSISKNKTATTKCVVGLSCALQGDWPLEQRAWHLLNELEGRESLLSLRLANSPLRHWGWSLGPVYEHFGSLVSKHPPSLHVST